MAFRIGRKFAQHTYPESRGLGAPPLAGQGFNSGDVNVTTAETTIATSTPVPFDGTTDEFLSVSFEYVITNAG